MRITSDTYYQNLFNNNNKVNYELLKVNEQISSGMMIQYANESPDIYSHTMRLDDEITTKTQVKESSQSAMSFSEQTDTTLGAMSKELTAFKVKLVQAANAGNSQTTLDALAEEMEGIRNQIAMLSNTSIDGKYLFSGSATETKPINTDGTYNGDDDDIKTFFGNELQQKYNISGDELFFGEESNVTRKVTTNISLYDQLKKYPDIMQDSTIPRNTGTDEYITSASTMRSLMGDTDNVVDAANAKHHFYIQGTTHDGVAFKDTVSLKDTETMQDLLDRIGENYGNSAANQVVSVTINNTGQIMIEDLRAGSSKMEFNIVANTSPYEATIRGGEITAIAGSGAETITAADFDLNGTPFSSDLVIPDPSTAEEKANLIIGKINELSGTTNVVASLVTNNAKSYISLINTINPVDSTGNDAESGNITLSIGASAAVTGFTPGTTSHDNFSAVSNLNELSYGTSVIKEFSNSNYTDKVATTNIEQNMYDPNIFELKNTFVTDIGDFANSNTILNDIFGTNTQTISFAGTQSDGTTAVATSLNITATTNLKDLMDKIKTDFDSASDLTMSYTAGKISIVSSTGNLEFTMTSKDALGNNIDGINSMAALTYDEASFLREGATLTSNIPQIIKDTNAYATDSTKMVDVSTKTSLTDSTNDSLYNVTGTDVQGNAFTLQMEFPKSADSTDGVTYTVTRNGVADSNTYNVFNVDGTNTTSDDLTYRQFMDAVNITVSNTTRTGTTHADQVADLATANTTSSTYLDTKGRLTFNDETSATTKAELNFFDENSNDMSKAGSMFSFQSNTALTVTDPKNDIFAGLDAIIQSVRDGKYDSNGFSGDPRNVGMQNSIDMIDGIADHFSRVQTHSGVQSNVLISTRDRMELLIVNTMQIRSEVLDTDLAEASLRLNQLSLNYQAMLSTVGKITQLSLVNYL
ncbi:MAG: hypothetical protein GQ570_15235 [Helicobacteraceae bacterium]|nr:hypothetical protein [Helicobacteraceae bacterium]